MTTTQSIVLAIVASFSSVTITLFFQWINRDKKIQLPDREFEEPKCPECGSSDCDKAYDRMDLCDNPESLRKEKL